MPPRRRSSSSSSAKRRVHQNPHNASGEITTSIQVCLQKLYFDGDQCGFALFPDETLASDAHRDLDYLETRRLPAIAGLVNGLFCLFNHDDRFIIWNPAIREFTTLPIAEHTNFPPNFVYSISCVGFGFDPSTDNDYKVVLIQKLHYYNQDMLIRTDVCVHVLSLSTNTWRRLDGLDYLLPKYLLDCDEAGAYSTGVYYWRAGPGILAFDMGNEGFRVISAPFILPPDQHKCGVKSYNDDRIALYQFKEPSGLDKSCEIWVMEKEGCWIKHITFVQLPCIPPQLVFWKKGKLLFLNYVQKFESHYVLHLVLYNPCTREHRYLALKENWFRYQILVCHESLVSINGGIHLIKGNLSDSKEVQDFFNLKPRDS